VGLRSPRDATAAKEADVIDVQMKAPADLYDTITASGTCCHVPADVEWRHYTALPILPARRHHMPDLHRVVPA
jgi:hypothetical protein